MNHQYVRSILVEVPQTQRPTAGEIHVGNQRPIFFLDLLPNLGSHARRRNGAGVPAVRGIDARVLLRFLTGFRQFLAANKRVMRRAVLQGGPGGVGAGVVRHDDFVRQLERIERLMHGLE